VKDYITQHKYTSSDKIANHMLTTPGGEYAAPRTIRDTLQKNNYKYGRPSAKPVLSDAAKNTRLVWSVLHRNDDFDRTVFADEACFAIGPDGRVALWHLGAIFIFGTVGFLSFAPTWNANTFSAAVIGDVVPSANAMFNNNWMLQLDNAPCHRSNVAQTNLLGNGVPAILFQPPSSPEVNPIENIWALLKRKETVLQAQNVQQLQAALTREWQGLMPHEVLPFATSMESRLDAVMASNGSHTKY